MDEFETLRKLGLTDYESKITLVLLSLGASKASEIDKRCDIPKNKIYESLQKLTKLGIVKEIPSNPKKYFIKDSDSLNILLKNKENELNELKKPFEELKKIKKGNLQSINEPVSIIYGTKAFLNMIKDFTMKLKKENLIVIKKAKADPVTLRITEEAVKRGVKIKMLVYEKNELLKEWAKIGVKIHYLKEKPEMIFSIFDDSKCRININLGLDINDPTIIIENRAFISILKEKFEKLWEEANRS
jgi:sugar-specific transcriptional regulator TrmB